MNQYTLWFVTKPQVAGEGRTGEHLQTQLQVAASSKIAAKAMGASLVAGMTPVNWCYQTPNGGAVRGVWHFKGATLTTTEE